MEQARYPLISQVIHRWATPFTVFVVTRLGLYLLAFFSLAMMPLNTGSKLYEIRLYPENAFLDGWTRWDGVWYENIAAEGYSLTPPFRDITETRDQRNTAFFPMYPLTIRVLGSFIGDYALAGLLISNLAFLMALILLYELVKNRFGEKTARTMIILMAIYPFSFYFNAVYTESLFLLSVVWAFYFGERKQWLLASLGAAVASATRVAGFLVVGGLLVLYLEQLDFDWHKVRSNILWIALGILGPLSYGVFLGATLGAPFDYITSQTGWGALKIRQGLEAVASLFNLQAVIAGQFEARDLFHLAFTVLALALTVLGWRYLPKSYAIWTTLNILFSLTRWIVMGRIAATTFTLFIIAAMILPERWHSAVCYASILMLALFTIMFTHWYWVA